MLALVIFGILIAYLALAVYAVRATLKSARESGLPPSKRRLRAGLVALVFYLIPFWDWIPTVVAHQYYCATEAKFEVFKTVEQWKAENAEVVPTLRYDHDAQSVQIGAYKRFPLNQRIGADRKLDEAIFPFLSIIRENARIVDTKTESVLVDYSDFRSGYAPLGVGGYGAWKFWLKANSCYESGDSPSRLYARYSSAMSALGGARK